MRRETVTLNAREQQRLMVLTQGLRMEITRAVDAREALSPVPFQKAAVGR